MLDFGLATTPIKPQSRPAPRIVDTVPAVTETVRVVQTPSQAGAYIMKADAEWGWQDLRDYVIREIEKRHGPQVRDAKKEMAIFKGFMSRWPEQSVAIARSAFNVHDGMWKSAPISVNRFCKASDEYFAAVLAARL